MVTLDVGPCPLCHQQSHLTVTDDQYDRIKQWDASRGLIQKYVPELSEGARELLISGTHPDCWDAMFAEFDDEDSA